MQTQKYSVNQHLIETLLVWVKSGEIAIPEIQRPFVWDGAKVRDLMDSLYHELPTLTVRRFHFDKLFEMQVVV